MYFQARTYTISMPYRVQRIEEFVNELESGELKLRVRVLEVYISDNNYVISLKGPIPGFDILRGHVSKN